VLNEVVMLNAGATLFPHHVDPQKMYDFSQPVAKMVRHPGDPNVWGIRNLPTDNWVSTTAAGCVNDVPPGRTVSLAVGTTIQFGKAEGEIRS
jgi:eukaryotic-like serine/threonine-protein kinase